jgi:hypothetical protein
MKTHRIQPNDAPKNILILAAAYKCDRAPVQDAPLNDTHIAVVSGGDALNQTRGATIVPAPAPVTGDRGVIIQDSDIVDIELGVVPDEMEKVGKAQQFGSSANANKHSEKMAKDKFNKNQAGNERS